MNTNMKAWLGVSIAGVLMCTACQTQPSPSVVPTPTAQIVEDGTTLAPVPTSRTELSPMPSPTTPGVSRHGNLDFPYESADAGNVSILAGATIEVTWTDAPLGAERYEFTLMAENSNSFLLGTDKDSSNGVSIQWIVPENLSATLSATAYFADGSSVTSLPSFNIYTGEAPPADVCTLRSTSVGVVDLYHEPYLESGTFAYIIPGTYHPVLGSSKDGWYQVDAQGAHELGSGKAASGIGWVHTRYPIGLSGPCEDVPEIPVTPSVDPFPTFTPSG